MPEPLEYRNPRSATNASGRKFPKPGETAPQAVIPPQFDKLLTKSEDHAAVRAIEAALRRAQIAFHTISDGERAKRQVQLYIATADFDRSAEIATTIVSAVPDKCIMPSRISDARRSSLPRAQTGWAFTSAMFGSGDHTPQTPSVK